MKPSEKAYELIKQFEGLQLRAYKAIPSEKYFTIGYGHYSQDIKRGQLITQNQAELFLHQDVASFAQKLATDCPNLEQNEYDALVSFIYNIGWYNFRYSMTREKVKNMHTKWLPVQVARQIILWVRAGGKVLLGLQKRRVIEANHFLGYDCFELKDGNIIEHSKPLLRDGK